MQKVIVRMALLEVLAVAGFSFMLGQAYERSKYEIQDDIPKEVTKKKRAIKIEDGKVIFDIASWR